MLFPIVMTLTKALVYTITGALKVKKVDAWELHREFKDMEKKKAALGNLKMTDSSKSTSIGGIDFDSLVDVPPLLSDAELPSADAIPFAVVETNGFSAIPPPLPTGMKLNAFKQQPVVCEVVDMSLSQPGEEYE